MLINELKLDRNYFYIGQTLNLDIKALTDARAI